MTDRKRLSEEMVTMMSPQPPRDIFSYPVIAYDHVIYISSLDFIEEHQERLQLIRTAGPDDAIRIVVNSPGGVVSLAISYVSAITESSATVVTHAEGTVASAGTLIWLAGQQRTVSPMTEFMFHNYQGYAGGDGANMYSQVNFWKGYFDRVIRKFYTGVLTEEEINRIVNGGQVWMDEEEIVKRTEATLLSKEYIEQAKLGKDPITEEDLEKGPRRLNYNPEVEQLRIVFTLSDNTEHGFIAENMDTGSFDQFNVAEIKLILSQLAANLKIDPRIDLGVNSKTSREKLIDLALQCVDILIKKHAHGA